MFAATFGPLTIDRWSIPMSITRFAESLNVNAGVVNRCHVSVTEQVAMALLAPVTELAILNPTDAVPETVRIQMLPTYC
jgi:hypothetical protein